jgi:choline dehydrogenase-like flavoprotein
MQEEMKQMFDAVGVKNISTWDGGHALGHGIHEMGTARMGRDPKTSVLNKWNQVWDCMNVFVTDGAFTFWLLFEFLCLQNHLFNLYGFNGQSCRLCGK